MGDSSGPRRLRAWRWWVVWQDVSRAVSHHYATGGNLARFMIGVKCEKGMVETDRNRGMTGRICDCAKFIPVNHAISTRQVTPTRTAPLLARTAEALPLLSLRVPGAQEDTSATGLAGATGTG